jgi:hypothetical protein
MVGRLLKPDGRAYHPLWMSRDESLALHSGHVSLSVSMARSGNSIDRMLSPYST